MDARKPAHARDEDVPIIGDYSQAQDKRLRAEPPRKASRPPPAQPAGESTHAHRTGDERLRLDPGDVRRHARRMRESERPSSLGKLVGYGLLVVVLAAAALLGYKNFGALRSAAANLSGLSKSLSDTSRDDGESAIENAAPETANAATAATASTPGGVDTTAATVSANTARPVDTNAAPATDVDATRSADTGTATPADDDTPTASETAAAAAPVEEATRPELSEPPSAEIETGPPAPPPAAEPQSEPEPPPGPESFAFGSTVVHVTEADTSANILILRNGDRRRRSSVTWWTEDGTATAGLDYANLGKVVVTFAPSEQNRTIHIPIARDARIEGPETFYVHLAKTDDAEAGEASDQRVEVVINDD